MKIIAIDLGTYCGVSILDIDGAPQIYTTALNSNRKTYGMQFAAFETALEDIISKYHKSKVCAVFFEDVKRHSSTAAAHMYGYYRGALQRLCHKYNIECVGIAVGTIKKHVTGSGNASKEMVAESCKERIHADGAPIPLFSLVPSRGRVPYAPVDISTLTDDQTDSIAIALTAWSMLISGEPLKDSSDPTRRVHLSYK